MASDGNAKSHALPKEARAAASAQHDILDIVDVIDEVLKRS
jgi:hypothetical protein